MLLPRQDILEEVDEFIRQQAKAHNDLLAVYLCGSFLEDEHTFGGVADVDLVCVYLGDVVHPRTIHPLTQEVHLDVAHHSREEYHLPRQLRQDPWLGSALNACRVIYDPQHFMDFVIAVVRDRFWHPENTYARAQKLLVRGGHLWQEVCQADKAEETRRVGGYLRAVGHLVQAVACLSGIPLAERRFLQQYRQRAAAIGHPGLYHGALGLLGAPFVTLEELQGWEKQVEGVYLRLGEQEDAPHLHGARRAYYLGGITALLDGEAPQEALWPLLRLWTETISRLPPQDEGREAWRQACQRVQLYGEGFTERCQALEAYRQAVQEALAQWARRNGVWNV